MEALRRERDQYFGTNAATRWAAWMSQDIRGLKMDAMRLDAASLSAKKEAYKSAQRTELMLGILVADKGRDMGAALDASYAEMMSRKVESPLR